MNIILFIRDSAERPLIYNSLKTNFTKFTIMEVMGRENALEFIENIEFPESAQIFVIDSLLGEAPEELKEIYDGIFAINPHHCIFFIGRNNTFKNRLPAEFYSAETPNDTIDFPINARVLRKSINEAINYIERYEMNRIAVELNEDEFHPVAISNFYHFEEAVSDVFHRIDEGRYVKVIEKKKQYHPSLIYKMQLQKIRILYMGKNEYLQYLIRTSLVLIDDLNKRQMDTEELIKAQMKAILVSIESVKSFGQSDVSVTLLKTILDCADKNLLFCKKFSDLIGMYPFGTGNMMERSLLMIYMAIGLLKRMHFLSETSRNILGIAAIFHDISLGDCALSKMTHLRWLDEIENLSESEKEDFLNHPREAYKVCKLLRGLPDASQVVLDHHQYPIKKGFPGKIHPSQMSELSIAFILIHFFVNDLYYKGISHENMVKITIEMKHLFEFPRFRKVVDLFPDLFEIGNVKF